MKIDSIALATEVVETSVAEETSVAVEIGEVEVIGEGVEIGEEVMIFVAEDHITVIGHTIETDEAEAFK